MANTNKLRVWHIPQIPGTPFMVSVPDVATAKLVLEALADYDAFQLKYRIKPDYSSASGLLNGEDEWCSDKGDEIWNVILSEAR